jgi:hypothetical protein
MAVAAAEVEAAVEAAAAAAAAVAFVVCLLLVLQLGGPSGLPTQRTCSRMLGWHTCRTT